MISILIASMGRPSLVDTLTSVTAARRPETEAIEIVIADDSSDGAVTRLLAGRAFDLPLRVLPVGAGNVALARNACLDAAAGDLLIFVDDDETVEPGWIEGHLSAARDHAADAVFGPVFPVYPEGTPAWFVAANPLFQDWDWQHDGKPTPRGRTGNTLIRRAALGTLRFDPAYGRSGGEDDDFFLRLAASGARMVVTDRARVHERVPAERARAAYPLRRAYRTGQLYAALRLRGRGRRFALMFTLDAAVKTAVGLGIGAPLFLVARVPGYRLMQRGANNLGKLKGAFGARPGAAWP